MKIAILGASGKAGNEILKEGKKRGLDITAIVRDANKIIDGTPVIEKDVYALRTEDIESFDVLVSALGFFEDVNQFTKSTQHLLDILNGQKTRLLVVGGAGSLYIDPAHTIQLSETKDFPEAFKPLATAMGAALNLLKTSTDIQWTFISPAAEFDPDGIATGDYTLAGEEFTTDIEGRSYISYADYAVALVDEIQNHAYPNQRISVRG